MTASAMVLELFKETIVHTVLCRVDLISLQSVLVAFFLGILAVAIAVSFVGRG